MWDLSSRRTHRALNGWILLFALVSLLEAVGKTTLRERFEASFESTCSKYAFVERHQQLLFSPKTSSSYFIYSFHEKQYKKAGGLGDRLAGLITATAFALGTNRVLLIKAEDSFFTSSFAPYFSKQNNDRNFNYADWRWSGWMPSLNTTTLHCLNPRTPKCSLTSSSSTYLDSYQVVKYRSNRNFLCYWLLQRSRQSNKLRTAFHALNITQYSNLYEFSGCLLRLSLWPTDSFWSTLEERYLRKQKEFKHGGLSTSTTSPLGSFQVGLHYRCGDASFSSTKINYQCYVNTSVQPWRGTDFIDSMTLDSPIDFAKCGQRIINHRLAKHPVQKDEIPRMVSFISSDYSLAAHQIRSNLANTSVVLPSQSACHLESSVKNKLCMEDTMFNWFQLAMSDVLIVQSGRKKKEKRNYSGEEKKEKKKEKELRAPASAFSRYAAMYGLLDDANLRFARECVEVDTFKIGWSDNGNWLCSSIY